MAVHMDNGTALKRAIYAIVRYVLGTRIEAQNR